MRTHSRWYAWILLAMAAGPAAPQVDVLTVNYDNQRTNSNLRETTLNTTNVNSSQFGKLFSLPVTGFISAQPLYWHNVAMPNNGTHNMVFVATMHNEVYAFDADAPGDSFWHVSLGPPVPGTAYNQVIPEVGILSTPVIDPASGTLYLVTDTVEDGKYYYRLHALDTGTGAEKFGGPTVIEATLPGTSSWDSRNGNISFDAFQQVQRPGLLLLNNTVYIGFGSHNDAGAYHGWLLGYDAGNVQQQVTAWISTPDGWGGAIWQSGHGPAADEQGNIYVGTGNGDVAATNWSESFLRFETTGGLKLADWFTPDNWSNLNDHDLDLGSCSPILAGSLLMGGGKEGMFYVMDRNQMGHSQTGNGQIIQNFQAIGYGIFNLAYWDNADGPIVYMRAYVDALKAFRMTNGVFGSVPFSQSTMTAGLALDGMAISANGSDPVSGVLWLTETDRTDYSGAGILRAFAATDLSRELWDSAQNPVRDGFGDLAKFATPTVANGKVYVPTFSNQLVVYGLLDTPTGTITAVVNAASGETGAIAPGEIVAVYGNNLWPGITGNTTLADPTDIGAVISNARVLFNGAPAALIYISPNQAAAIVPNTLAGHTATTVRAEVGTSQSPAVSVKVVDAAPGLFTVDESGSGQGAILNQDGTVNGLNNPASRGAYVTLYGTGQGLSSPSTSEARLAAPPYPVPVLQVSVTIGGQAAQVLWAGSAPGFAGLMQVNAQIPSDVTPGQKVPVVLTVGTAASRAVTIAVK